MRTIEGTQSASGFTFAVVVSKYNDFVTDRLQAGAVAALEAAGAAPDGITIVRVPGAFEIPLAARHAAESGRFSAIVCLGCLIRGATPHFEYIASAVVHGLTSAAADTGVPMTFGVLTTNSIEEALQRAADGPSNKGWEAAAAAVEMAAVAAELGRGTVGDVSEPPAP
jgi:6,7-dimethyl-8-ribityllumazine synthase